MSTPINTKAAKKSHNASNVTPPSSVDENSSKVDSSQPDNVKRPPTPPENDKTEDGCSSSEVTDQFAFAFDIDGVLTRGGQVIPEAIEALKMLNGKNGHQVKV